MSSNKAFRFGPLLLTTTMTTNLLNPPAASGGVNAGSSPAFIALRHLRVSNKSGAQATFSLWLGASGANASGTEFVGANIKVEPGAAYDWYGANARIESSQFLVGGASATNALTISGEGEIGLA